MELLIAILKIILASVGIFAVFAIIIAVVILVQNLKKYVSESVARMDASRERQDAIVEEARNMVVRVGGLVEKYAEASRKDSQELHQIVFQVDGKVNVLEGKVAHVNRKVNRLADIQNVPLDKIEDNPKFK